VALSGNQADNRENKPQPKQPEASAYSLSTKFGFSFEHVRTKSCERLAVFLLIVMLASLLACLTGWCLEKLKHQFQYQANSIKL